MTDPASSWDLFAPSSAPATPAVSGGARPLLIDAGEMHARYRQHDWASTALGPADQWPPSLRTAVQLVLDAPRAMSLSAGPAFVTLYNDAYRRLLGAKHPDAFGRPAAEVWAELWPVIGPQYARVRAGESMDLHDVPFAVARLDGGGVDDAWFDYALSPIRASSDDTSAVVAVLSLVTETTGRVRAEAERASLVDALRAANAELRDRQRALEEQTTVADRARAAAEAAAVRTRDVLAQAPVYIVVTEGPEHRFTLVNAQAEAFTRRRDLVGRTYIEAYPELADSLVVMLDQVYATGEPVVVHEARVAFARPGSGEASAETGYDELYLDLVFQPLRAPVAAVADDARVGDRRAASPAGPVTGILHFAVDVTARQRAATERERLLAEAQAANAAAEADRQRLAAVVEHLPIGVTFAEAPDGSHAMSNPAAVAIWGTVPASPEVTAYSRDFLGYRPGPGAPGSAEEAARRIASHEWPLARALGCGEVIADELAEIERPDGTRRLVSLSAAPVRDTQGHVAGALVTSVDVTEREATLRALEATRAAAEAANKAKSEFLTVMSHELRTPLNAIDGYAELIELGIRGPVTTEQRTDLARIRKSQKHLLGLINGVLNYAQVEAGAVHYDFEAVSVEEVLVTCEALTLPQARTRRLSLRREPCDPRLCVHADREKLQQVLLNLVSNAIKFTEPGGEVVLSSEPAGVDAVNCVRIRVRDSGIGIAPHQLVRVFEPFVQVDTELTRTRDGTGLGLAISRDLARAMGGELTVESTLGAGSTFTLSLPSP